MSAKSFFTLGMLSFLLSAEATMASGKLDSPIQVDVLPPAALGTSVIWSPSGQTFAYASNPTQGKFILGTISPLRTSPLTLPDERQLVALTDHYAIASSWSETKDWLYPIHGTTLGAPIPWHAATDTWQEWANTAYGPAILTGGYKPHTLALTTSTGKKFHINGGQVYFSTDRKFGAVAWSQRAEQVVHPAPGLGVPIENQFSNADFPISIWNFDAPNGPKRVSTLHPNVSLPTSAGIPLLQWVTFSYHDQYVAVLAQGSFGGPKLLGQTLIFNVRSGRLVGIAPYGNGIKWIGNSQYLWIGTPYPEGQGYDRIVNVRGTTISIWTEQIPYTAILPVSPHAVIMESLDRPELYLFQSKGDRTTVYFSPAILYDGNDTHSFGNDAIGFWRHTALLIKNPAAARASRVSNPLPLFFTP